MNFCVNTIVYTHQSLFQHIQIIDTIEFGRQLVLDYKIQSSTKDEHFYHETLVHPAMLRHLNPEIIFIGGGGELATAREILKYKSVKELIMVDLDKDVVNACIKYLPSMTYNVMSDNRFKLIIDNAYNYLKKYKNKNKKFDIIFMDIVEPTKIGPGIICYYKSFYNLLKNCLNKNGIFVTQSGSGGYLTYKICTSVIYNTVKSVFYNCKLYTQDIPSFGMPWSFTIGFKNKNNFILNNENIINNRIKKRNLKLKHYDGKSHSSSFYLPKYLRKALQNEKRIMTKETPVFTI